MIKKTDHFQNEFSSVWSELPGYKTSWLDHIRLKAINRFSQNGFPQPRAEDWKYTDLSAITEKPYRMIQADAGEIDWDAVKSVSAEVEASLTMIFVDGHFKQLLGDPEKVIGLNLSSLKEAIDRRDVLLKEYLASDRETLNAFESLNTAFMSDGVCLSLDPGIQLAKPIHLIHVKGAGTAETGFNTRNILVFGENSKAVVLESNFGFDANENYLANAVTQTIVKQGADVEYCKIQDEGAASVHFAVNRVYLEKESKYATHYYAFGGKLSRETIKVDFEGENATCHINSLIMMDGNRQADFYSDLEHKVPRCKSDEIVKGVMDQNSKAVIRGKIKVFQDAQKTDARFNTANLLLSNDAEVDTMPQLEIYADDVKCNHGSTSGQLDDEQLFYLRSRGVDKTSAHGLLIFAFANSVISKIGSEDVRDFVKSRLMKKLPADSNIKELVK